MEQGDDRSRPGSRKALDQNHEPRLAAALFVLDPVPAAVPVLPRDPLEVLHLEREEADDPEKSAGLRHEGRFLTDQNRFVNPTFG